MSPDVRSPRSVTVGVHRRCRSVVLAGLLVLGLGASALAEAPRSLRELLSPEDFRRAGLDKLTADELAFLSARVLQPVPTPPPAKDAAREVHAALPRGEDAFGDEARVEAQVAKSTAAPKEIRSRIVGMFGGWSGQTVFRLANGQVWQQITPGEFAVNLDSPEISIRRSPFGAYLLSVAGYGSQVKVKRLK